LLYDHKQLLKMEVWADDMRREHLLSSSQGAEVQQLLAKKGPRWIKLEGKQRRKTASRLTKVTNTLTTQCSKKRHKREGSNTASIRADFLLFRLVGNQRYLTSEPSCHIDAEPIAVLVCRVIQGRMPPSRVQGTSLRASIAGHEAECRISPADKNWRASMDLSGQMYNMIEVLVKGGFPSQKIAKILKIEESVVNKVKARSLNFNAEVPQLLCVLVPCAAFPDG